MTADTPTLAEAQAWARQTLQQGDLDDADPAVDSRVLLCHCLQKAPVYLHTWPDKTLSREIWQVYQHLVHQRRQGIPVAHLTQQRGFWNLSLEVSPKTLIPRPDTEVLVEKALSLFDDAPIRVLDLGTGTGAIALALASERPAWQITGSDFDADIVALARSNATRNQINNAHFECSDWFAQLPEQPFALIVSNPPYVESDSAFLQRGDVRFEPWSALVAEQQGLADLHHIIAHAGKYLLDSGWLVLEHGYQQAPKVRRLMAQHGFSQITSLEDYAGQQRVTLGQWSVSV